MTVCLEYIVGGATAASEATLSSCPLRFVVYVSTVKPVLMATCIQRPPVLRGHSVMSQRCLRNIC